MNNQIGIREFQHFVYCPRQWGLIQINQTWSENYFVTKANLIHEKVHTIGQTTSKAIKTLYSLPVYWDDYNIYGILDCMEIEEDIIRIIEYKPSQKKSPSKADILQLFIQRLCVRHIFSSKNIDCYFYYADTRKRYQIFFNEDEMWNFFLCVREQILDFKERGIIPSISDTQNCGGCSLKDICLPKTKASELNKRIKTSLKK